MYKSIDLCISCAFHEDKWINVLTLLRFAHEDVDLLKREILEKPHLENLGKGKRFRIYRKSFPPRDFEELAVNLLNGSIRIGDITVHYRPADIKNFNITFYRSDSQFTGWGAFFVYRSASDEIRNKLPYDSFKSDVIPYGFADIYAAIRVHYNIEFGPNHNSDFMIRAPVYAKIEDMKLEGKKITITVRYHKNLSGLYLHYNKRVRLGSQITMPLAYEQTQGSITPDDDFKIWKIEAEEIDISGKSYEEDSRDVDLYLNQMSQLIHDKSRKVTEMIAEKRLLATNPLAKIFARFCPIEEFTELFTNPTNVSNSGIKLDKSDNFERAVYWLFTLHGFQAIWLGDHEIIDGKKQSGSTDLLCYSSVEKVLAVVSCKIRVPNHDDVDKIRNLADKVSKDTIEFGIRVVPIIVSSEPSETMKQVGSKDNVDIIDVNDIQGIISKIHEVPPTPRLLLRTIRTSTTGTNPLGYVVDYQ